MNNLPCELIVEIIKKLNYDFIKILELRLISKRWSIMIKDHIKFKELNIIRSTDFFPNIIDLNYCWFYSNLPYNPDYNLNIYSSNNYLNSILFKKLFSQLEYLNLNYYLFDLKIIVEFNSLKQLEIRSLSIRKDEFLNLPNLITLAIYSMYEQNSDLILEIKAIKLQNLLFTGNFKQIKIKYPESIKYLDISDNKGSNYLTKFINLDILFLYNLNSHFNLELITHNLKELNFKYYFEYEIRPENKSFYYELLDKKQKLNRTNLVISIGGIKLIDRIQFDKIGARISFDCPFSLFNNQILIKSPWFNLVELKFFLESNRPNNILNDDLFSKFNNIQILKSSYQKENDADYLINLISKLKNLRSLDIEYASFNQDFYLRLPKVCEFLNHLNIQSKKDLNLENTIGEFKHLCSFKTDQQLKLEFLFDYLNSNKHLYFIEILVGNYFNRNYKLRKISPKKWIFECRHEFDETINFKSNFNFI